MFVSIVLDNHHNTYINLDVISGKVLLRHQSPLNVSSIIVKLEGESRTRLLSPGRPDRNDKPRPVVEVHKVLYRVAVVFPPQQVTNTVREDAWSNTSYTIPPGQFEYPFSFKFPINNACQDYQMNNTSLTGLLQKQTPLRHVKRTLPPSLTGFPGEAEIRYYVKVTVNRPQFYLENPRAFANFNFLPIEDPRPPRTQAEVYARRQEQFEAELLANPKSPVRKESLFGKAFSRKASTTNLEPPALPPSSDPARFQVEFRLPEPPILTCNDDLPLKILVRKLNDFPEPLYLQILQIELIGYTKVRAHDVVRDESNSWVITSQSNMGMKIGNWPEGSNTGQDVEISREWWQRRPLHNTVAPTFTTCNISRFYELEVRLGIAYGNSKALLKVCPLRLPVQVFSGIAPPPELLARAARKATIPPMLSVPSAGFDNKPSAGSNMPPPTPVEPPSPAMPPPQQGNWHAAPPPAHGGVNEEDAPPSYEDAIAGDLPPIDGPRRNYAPPPPREDGNFGTKRNPDGSRQSSF